MPVAVVVVSYNAAGHLRTCLESFARDGVAAPVVVDNGSTDSSRAVAAAAGARWIDSGGNLGYGRAANLGATLIAPGAEFLLVCNPDIEVRPGSLAVMATALRDDPTLGVVGPAIFNSDGSLYPSARTFPDMVDAVGHGLLGAVWPRNPFTRRYRLLDWDHATPARVDWVSGACLMVRRSVWELVGGFDPAYFMYMEDVDLCWRIGRAGWGVAYAPDAKVVHVQGVSADLHPYRMLAAHHRSMWRFALRTTTGARRAALPLVAAGLGSRLAVTAAQRRFWGSRGRPAEPIGAGREHPTGAHPPRPLP